MVPGALTHSSRTLPDQQRCSWARGWWSLKGPRPGHPRRPGEGPTSHSGARVPTPCPVPTTAQTQLYSPRSSSLTPSQLPSGLVSVLHLGRQWIILPFFLQLVAFQVFIDAPGPAEASFLSRLNLAPFVFSPWLISWARLGFLYCLCSPCVCSTSSFICWAETISPKSFSETLI